MSDSETIGRFKISEKFAGKVMTFTKSIFFELMRVALIVIGLLIGGREVFRNELPDPAMVVQMRDSMNTISTDLKVMATDFKNDRKINESNHIDTRKDLLMLKADLRAAEKLLDELRGSSYPQREAAALEVRIRLLEHRVSAIETNMDKK